MTGPVSVRAGWAIWSKQQASRDDYSVLAASAQPLSRDGFGRVLAHFAPGNPPAESGASSSLPWIMLSRVGIADKPYVAISVQDAADYVDGTGRPVSRTRYLCVAYDDIAAEPVSYLGLHQAANSVPLPAEDDAQVTLAVPPLDPAALAQDIAGFGVDFVAATAALLLAGPVTITGPELPGWPDRLRFLDAVAALLPYGYRAHYTASTWSDTGASASRFRIVFARRAGEKSFAVPWKTAPELRSPDSIRYHASLARALDRTGEPDGDIADLTALINYLARQTGQHKFEEPWHALRIIGKFRPAWMIANDISTGKARPGEIRDAFDQWLDQQWAPGIRRLALAKLIEAPAADPRDAEIISTRLPGVGGESARELLPVVARACRRLLWSDEDAGLIRVYLHALRRFHLDDGLLAALLAPSEPTATDDRLDVAAALVADFVVDDPAYYPRTCEALAGNLAVGTALISRLCAGRGNAVATDVIGWLAPDLPHVLQPFRTILNPFSSGGGTQADPDEVGGISDRGGPAGVRYLLRVASRSKSLMLVLPPVAYWLCQESLSGGEAADGHAWQELSMELAPGNEIEAAWLDLVLLAAHVDPKSMLTGKYATTGFARTLAAEWASLIDWLSRNLGQGQAADKMLTVSLIGYLGRADWRADQTKADIVSRLGDLLTAGGRRPPLAAAVLDIETTLRGMSARAPTAQIAEACLEACLGGLETGNVAGSLTESGAIASGFRAAEVLDQLHWMAVMDPRVSGQRRKQVADWEFQLAKMVVAKMQNDRDPRDFATTAARISMEEFSHYLKMLSLAVDSNRATGAPSVLGHADIDELKRWYGTLRKVIEDATSPAADGSSGLISKVIGIKKTRDAGGDTG